MRFLPTPISGAWLIEPEVHEDERGHFGRTFCASEFAAQGLDPNVAQTSVSFNLRRGTVRGMHWSENGETRLLRVNRGAIFDVLADLRGDGPPRAFGVELNAVNGIALYVPVGCAHGFQTLADDTEVGYQMNVPFEAGAARGARWDDPSFNIKWPLPVTVISEKDRSWPPLAQTAHAPS
jgi:dTDP-4-dehydrorhamnose 3,5-epimerase